MNEEASKELYELLKKKKDLKEKEYILTRDAERMARELEYTRLALYNMDFIIFEKMEKVMEKDGNK